MNIIKFERNCPVCGKSISYNRKDTMIRAIKQNRLCFNCNIPKGNKHYRFGKHCSEETKQKISKSKIGIPIHSEEEKEKRRKRWLGNNNPTKILGHSPFLGKQHTDKTKQKMSVDKKGIKNPFYGKRNSLHPNFGKHFTTSPETKCKLRKAAINYIINKNGGICPMFNKKAIEYFKQLEIKNGWNGKYATKSDGEHHISNLGYFVDYYEPTLNMIIEYDESYHYYSDGQLRKKDTERMNEIISHLKCKFFRYDEKRKILKEYH
jgi:hypothetical protein